MTASTPTSSQPAPFTQLEWWALRGLRARYHEHADLFSDRELAHLHFLRWLFQTGRLSA
jgi:hypothetical protein